MDGRKNKQKLERDSWIQAGIELILSEGISSISVERLARRLKISKGSFYWHFRDRGDLLDAMATAWEGRQPDLGMGEMQDRSTASGRWANFLAYASLWEQARFDLAMKLLAIENAQVRSKFARVEKSRAESFAQIFREIGFQKSQAWDWAQLTLLMYTGWVERAARDPKFREESPPVADVLSKLLLAASTLAGQEATTRE